MQNLVKRLEKRGWSKREISKAIKIIKKAKENKPGDVRFLEKRVYWILLLVLITANFAISVALLPVLVTLKGILLYIIVGIIALAFGFIFEIVIRSIEHLEKKHHIVLAFLIPLIALVNFLAISKLSNNLGRILNLNNAHNSVILGMVYASAFVLPHLIYRFVLKIGYYAKN